MDLLELSGMSHDMVFALKWVLDENRLSFRDDATALLLPPAIPYPVQMREA
jgi:hypothetical protein